MNQIVLKENDVYSISYTDAFRKTRTNADLNWCFEGLAVVHLYGYPTKELVLVDNFWETVSQDKKFTLKDVGTIITASFLFNLDDVRSIGEYDRRYYRKEDIFHLSRQHACAASCLNYYVKKDAVRDREAMLKFTTAKIKESERSIESAKQSIEWDSKILEKINVASDEELEKIYI